MTNFNSNKNSNKQKNSKEGENNMKNYNLNEENENINNNTEETGNGTENTNEDNGIAPAAVINRPVIWPIYPVSNYCRVALFVGGFCDNGNGFAPTISSILARDNDGKFYQWADLIDMTNFNVETDDFTLTSQKTDFEDLVYDIVTDGKLDANQGKTILVRTYLNKIYDTDINCDSIENQTKKLIYIIDEFSKYSDVEVFLVGHSQGGLVNLGAAVERKNYIEKLVSIVTPYAPAYLAKVLEILDFITTLAGKSIYYFFAEYALDGSGLSKEELEEAKQEYMKHYKSCIQDLCNNRYFTELKDNWNNLTNRPRLYTITATAGKLATFSDDSGNPHDCELQQFDGLVRLKEQEDIDANQIINVVADSLPCSSNEECSISDNCRARTLNILQLVLDIFAYMINHAGNMGNLNYAQIPALEAVSTAMQYVLFNSTATYITTPGYENFANVYANNTCNHGSVRTNTTTISELYDLLSTP